MAWKIRDTCHNSPVVDVRPAFEIQCKVRRIEHPKPTVFFKRYVEGNQPVVIMRAMEECPAVGLWSDEYLNTHAGDQQVEVIVSSNGLYPDYVTRPEPMKKVYITLSELLPRLVGGIQACKSYICADETYYLYGKPHLFHAVPRLLQDVPNPACLRDTLVVATNLWLSSVGCVTPLHYDLTNGLLVQIRGVKKIYLFSPDQFAWVYPRGQQFPGMDNFERQSRVDIHHPDYVEFPAFKRTRALECTLYPGESLFIPSNWFHEVESLQPSISVNYTFAGGTQSSELACMVDTLRDLMGEQPSLSELEAVLRSRPALLNKMLDIPNLLALINKSSQP